MITLELGLSAAMFFARKLIEDRTKWYELNGEEVPKQVKHNPDNPYQYKYEHVLEQLIAKITLADQEFREHIAAISGSGLKPEDISYLTPWF